VDQNFQEIGQTSARSTSFDDVNMLAPPGFGPAKGGTSNPIESINRPDGNGEYARRHALRPGIASLMSCRRGPVDDLQGGATPQCGWVRMWGGPNVEGISFSVCQPAYDGSHEDSICLLVPDRPPPLKQQLTTILQPGPAQRIGGAYRPHSRIQAALHCVTRIKIIGTQGVSRGFFQAVTGQGVGWALSSTTGGAGPVYGHAKKPIYGKVKNHGQADSEECAQATTTDLRLHGERAGAGRRHT